MSEDTSEHQPKIPENTVIAGDVSMVEPLYDSDRAIILGDTTIDSYKPQYDKYITDDAKTGLILIIDKQEPVYMPYWGDLVEFTGCANAEDYLKLVSELSLQEPTPKPPIETIKTPQQ